LSPKREESERTCIVTRQPLPADALIRFVVGPDGELVPDLRRRLPGRGVWVTGDATTVAEAEKKSMFSRAFGAPVTVAPGLVDRVDALLSAAALASLSFARKAGTLVGGFAKIEAALAHDDVVGLVHASDAGDDGVAKLAAAARRRFGEGKPVFIRCFDGAHLDLALGRPNVVHAALLAGPASANVLARVWELVRFRGGDAPPNAAGNRLFDASTGTNERSAGAIETTMGKHD